MLKGSKCPECGSTDTGDGQLDYIPVQGDKVCGGWSCDQCGCSYAVIYNFEKIEIYERNWGE